jgi:hypothetical protein
MKMLPRFLPLFSLALVLLAFTAKTNALPPLDKLRPTQDDTPTSGQSAFEVISAGQAITPVVSTYIDEPILLDSSETVTPSFLTGDEFGFRFSGISLVLDGTYNDFDLAYETSSSCDSDVWAFNYGTESWDSVGFSPSPGTMCLPVLMMQSHLFSALGLESHQYLNPNLEMKVRGYVGQPVVRALRINPDYLAVPIVVRGVHSFDGFAYDGRSFWLSSNMQDRLYQISLSGTIEKELVTPSGYPFGLAFDGQSLWLADGTDRIFELTSNGDILCQFTLPTDYPGGLTWGDDKLWLTEYGGSRRLFGIEPDASCHTGTAFIADELQTPGSNGYGLAWDGTHLLVASDSLYKVTTAGNVMEVYHIPVASVRDIAWDGEAVWLFNQGPTDVWGRDPVITRFRLHPRYKIHLPTILRGR